MEELDLGQKMRSEVDEVSFDDALEVFFVDLHVHGRRLHHVHQELVDFVFQLDALKRVLCHDDSSTISVIVMFLVC